MTEPPTWRLTEAAREAWTTLASRLHHDPALAARAAAEVRFFTHLGPEVARAWHRPVLAGARRQGVAGITLGPWVYLYGPAALRRWPLIVHETMHAYQYLHRGTPRFLLGYVSEWTVHRLRGRDARTAYLDLHDEREARAIEQIAHAHPPPPPWVEPTR
jgi:hypothetical protein